MPGSRTSSTYRARPVALSAASRRGGLLPIMGETIGKRQGRLDDLHVARAAAKISRQRGADNFPLRMSLARKQLGQRHHYSRRAEPALDGARIDQGFLYFRETFNTFDRGHLPLAHIGGEGEAGSREFAVEQHRTGTAHAVVAAALGAGELELIAQYVEQRRGCRRQELPLLTV